jgi:hypothetical protein
MYGWEARLCLTDARASRKEWDADYVPLGRVVAKPVKCRFGFRAEFHLYDFGV